MSSPQRHRPQGGDARPARAALPPAAADEAAAGPAPGVDAARPLLPDAGLGMAALGLAWLAGIALQLRQPVLWGGSAYLGLAAASLPLLWAARRPLRSTGSLCLAAAALALLGFGCTGWRAVERLADVLPTALEGQDLLLTGVIARMPQASPSGTRFVLDVERAVHRGRPARVPSRVWLGWYGDFEGETPLTSPLPQLRAGQRWAFTARLRQPHGNLNPHGFDLELWLFERRIGATGQVRTTDDAPPPRLLATGVAHPVERARQWVRDAIALHVGDADAAGVLAALAVGDQAAIERDDWELFRHTGVAHLMSISGLHVTMFAWLAGALIGPLWRFSARLTLAVPAPLAARWGGVLLAGGYALLAGWGVPAQRTLWMLATVALLRTSGVSWPAPFVLLLAAVVVTAVDPWALLQPGFWLSFAAVALLMVAQPAAAVRAPAATGARLRAALAGGVRTQAVASVGLAPLGMIFFQQVSLVGFVANLLAIPLVTLAITPLALLGVVLPALWQPAGALVQALTQALGWLAGWPHGVWFAAAPPPWAAAGGLLGAALLVMPLPWRLRLLGVPLLLPLLLPPPAWPAEGEFEAVVADVGQGTAVLLRTRRHLLVYDAGPRPSSNADAGERVLLPLLRARGDHRIDLLMLSHRDSDHVGGAPSLLARREVQALTSSLDADHPLLAPGLPHRRCEAGQAWTWDGVRFAVLHPLAQDYRSGAKSNALSCVLRVQAAGGASLLLTGDIESAQEAALVQRLGEGLRSQVLLVPHHGSRTSSSEAFVRAVAPRTAVVQAGYRSRFGHPAPPVVERYRALGIDLRRSDACGAWSWRSDGGAACERDRAARYWHHRVAGGFVGQN